jgi:hypothetical protein
MESETNIQYLTNDEINFIKWDNCINNSHNGNIYALSWYLDIICEDWSALVYGDYESVMPLLHTRRAGISYTFTTYLANQLGVFSTYILDEEKVNAFVSKLATVYPYFFVNLNKFNKVDSSLFRQKPKSTFEFDLIGDYDSIKKKYTPENLQALNFSNEQKVSVIRGMMPNEFLEFVSRKNMIKTTVVKTEDIQKLRQIIAFIMRHGLGDIYAAYDFGNNLIASVLFLKSNRKINVLFTAVTSDGLQDQAMNQLVDHYIQKNAGKNLTLNFENLTMPEKSMFCKGFGGREYHYTHVWNSRIPWYSRIMMKLLK